MPVDRDIQVIRALAEFRYSLRDFLAASEEVSKSAGVTSLQYQAILAICAWSGPISVGDLAAQLLVRHSSALQLFDRLAAAGLARREPSPQDGRVALLKLTAEGDRVLIELAGRHLKVMQSRRRELSAALRRLGQIELP
jgi:DNA-binding MarR family transcriptional regulator